MEVRRRSRHVHPNASTSRPVGPRQGNIRLLPAPLTKQNCSTMEVVCVCVCLSSKRQRIVTAWPLRPRRIMAGQWATCSIWSHVRTPVERGCQYSTCVCLITFLSASQLWHPHISAIISPHTCEVTGVYVACPGTGRMIMRWVLISQVSWTDMNNTGHFITHLPPSPSLSALFYYYSSRVDASGAVCIP